MNDELALKKLECHLKEFAKIQLENETSMGHEPRHEKVDQWISSCLKYAEERMIHLRTEKTAAQRKEASKLWITKTKSELLKKVTETFIVTPTDKATQQLSLICPHLYLVSCFSKKEKQE